MPKPEMIEPSDAAGPPPGKGPQGGKDAKVLRFGTDSIPKLLAEFAIPAIVGMIVTGTYIVIDSIFLGNATHGEGVGEIGLATIQVAQPVMIFFMALSMLVGNGGNALAAIRLGQGKREDAETSLGNTIFLSVVLAAIVACFALPVVMNALLDISSTTEEVRPHASAFITILCFGFIVQCVGMGVNNFIRTAGAPIRAFGTMFAGTLACIALNYLFVIVLGWGVKGSALATIGGHGVTLVTVFWYFIKTKNVPLRIRLRFMKPVLPIIKLILSLGFASFIVQAALAIMNVVYNYVMVQYGAMHPIGSDYALAALGVTQRVTVFMVLPLVGMAVANQPLLGFNYGARKISRVRETLFYSMAAVTAIGVIGWLIAEIFPEQIILAFGINDMKVLDSGVDSADVLVFATQALRVQMMMIPLAGSSIVGAQYFQATGQPLKAGILAMTRQIIFLVPLLLLFPIVLPGLTSLTSLDAIYYAVPASDVLAFLTVGAVIVFELRRLKRLEAEYAEEGSGASKDKFEQA